MKAEVGGGVEELRTAWVSGSHGKEPKMGSGWQILKEKEERLDDLLKTRIMCQDLRAAT